MKTVNVSLVGVGGQGIILTADILAKTAAIAGMDVKKSEIHGMAQRGGSVTSQVRFGSSVASPIIQEGTADILVSFDKVEALRNSGILAKGGTALVNDLYLVPVTVSSGQQKTPEDLDGKVVYLKLVGHCGSCPFAMMTLKQGIEVSLREIDPEITVERVEA